jgi:hypothetical protein
LPTIEIQWHQSKFIANDPGLHGQLVLPASRECELLEAQQSNTSNSVELNHNQKTCRTANAGTLNFLNIFNMRSSQLTLLNTIAGSQQHH